MKIVKTYKLVLGHFRFDFWVFFVNELKNICAFVAKLMRCVNRLQELSKNILFVKTM